MAFVCGSYFSCSIKFISANYALLASIFIAIKHNWIATKKPIVLIAKFSFLLVIGW